MNKSHHKSHLASEFEDKMLGPRSGRTVSASLRNQHALGHLTKAFARTKVETRMDKLRKPRGKMRLRVSLRNGKSHGHVTKGSLRKNLQEKCRKPGGAWCIYTPFSPWQIK